MGSVLYMMDVQYLKMNLKTETIRRRRQDSKRVLGAIDTAWCRRLGERRFFSVRRCYPQN